MITDLEENFSTSGGDEGSDGLGVEPGEGESEAAVHRVGRQLERHLADVVLKLQVFRQVGVLQKVLDGAARVDQLPDLCRQDSGLRIRVRKFGNVLVLLDAVGLPPADGREADVVLLKRVTARYEYS